MCQKTESATRHPVASSPIFLGGVGALFRWSFQLVCMCCSMLTTRHFTTLKIRPRCVQDSSKTRPRLVQEASRALESPQDVRPDPPPNAPDPVKYGAKSMFCGFDIFRSRRLFEAPQGGPSPRLDALRRVPGGYKMRSPTPKTPPRPPRRGPGGLKTRSKRGKIPSGCLPYPVFYGGF